MSDKLKVCRFGSSIRVFWSLAATAAGDKLKFVALVRGLPPPQQATNLSLSFWFESSSFWSLAATAAGDKLKFVGQSRMNEGQIIIVGFMGSGKSTVARALAGKLDSDMIDLDEEITRSDGRSPKQIIEDDGEAAFRDIETQVLSKILRDHPARVIALGGGAWTLPRNRDLITQVGAVSIWLDAPFDLCWQRIVVSGNDRPLARNQSQARMLYNERRTSYNLAKLHVSASEFSAADQIAEEIIEVLRISEK